MMDIDHISIQKEKRKHFHICCVKGHTTEKCFFNLKTKTKEIAMVRMIINSRNLNTRNTIKIDTLEIKNIDNN